MIQHRCCYSGALEYPKALVEGVYNTEWVCDECASILAAIIAERKGAIVGAGNEGTLESVLTKWTENLRRGIAEAYGGKTSGPVFMDDATPTAQAVPSPIIEAARNGEAFSVKLNGQEKKCIRAALDALTGQQITERG